MSTKNKRLGKKAKPVTLKRTGALLRMLEIHLNRHQEVNIDMDSITIKLLLNVFHKLVSVNLICVSLV